jgi:hypothetical protein
MIENIAVKEIRLHHVGRYVTLHQTTLGPVRFLLNQIMAQANPHGGDPSVKLRGGNRVTYPAKGWERLDVELPDPPSREVIVDRDEAGEITGLRCPNPSCAESDIAEVDSCTRWNRLDVDDGVIGGVLTDADFAHVGWVCQHCGWDLTSDLDASEVAFS